jgi:hypothetical protein
MKSGQNVDLWTFCNHNEGFGGSRWATKFLKIERTIFYFLIQKHENSKILKIEYFWQ